MYLLRLDDASEYMDVDKWNRMEMLLDKYSIKPIVGIIPNNQDELLINNYQKDLNFWDKAKKWQHKNWTIAMHGYDHVYLTHSGGINPVNLRSEFAGVPLNIQKEKILNGIKIFEQHSLHASIFFAPSHTFDMNTLKALRLASDIRVINDTISNNIYKIDDFYFIPQQSGKVRKLPFKVTTFCYHPNNMNGNDFEKLESFIISNRKIFASFQDIELIERNRDLYDKFVKKMYFLFRSIRSVIRG